MPELTEAVRKLLCNNKAGYNVPAEYVEAMDMDQLMEIITAYFDWLAEAKKSSPN